MKRILSFLCAALVSVLFAAPALADVIWEPEDSFYSVHREDCAYLNRSYIANGPEGYVTVQTSPKEPKTLDTLPNGTVFHVSFGYPKENPTWAVVEYVRDDAGQVQSAYGGDAIVGWVPMDSLLLQYDGQSFKEEYATQLRPYRGESLDTLPQNGDVRIWPYPGAAESTPLTLDSGYMDHPEFQQLYTDNNDRLWGSVDYYMGQRSFWICLSDPTAEDLPITEIHYEGLIPAAEPGKTAFLPTAQNDFLFVVTQPLVLAGVLVVAVIAVTLLLLRHYRRKNPNP